MCTVLHVGTFQFGIEDIACGYFVSLDVSPALEASALFYMCLNSCEIG